MVSLFTCFHFSRKVESSFMKKCFLDYEILLPPKKIDYEHWDKAEATAYLEWFASNIPDRSCYLLGKCFQKKKTVLDCIASPAVLVDIWRWFLKHAGIEDKPKETYQKQLEKAHPFGEAFVSQKQFDIKTEFIIRDIVMLVSAMFLSLGPSLNLVIEDKPDRYVFKNHPVIAGFVDTSYNPPFPTVFEPVHMVRIQALKKIKGLEKDTDLLLLYQKWESLIPLSQPTH